MKARAEAGEMNVAVDVDLVTSRGEELTALAMAKKVAKENIVGATGQSCFFLQRISSSVKSDGHVMVREVVKNEHVVKSEGFAMKSEIVKK